MFGQAELVNLNRAAKGSLEGRKFPEGRLENMSGTESVRLGRSPHTISSETRGETVHWGKLSLFTGP